MRMNDIEKRARELLAMTLGERGFHCEAENVRGGEDLESYEGELQAIAQLLRWGFDTPQEHASAALTPPEGYVLIRVLDARRVVKGNPSIGGYELSLSRIAAALAGRPEVSP
jgi:hypothetical protein